MKLDETAFPQTIIACMDMLEYREILVVCHREQNVTRTQDFLYKLYNDIYFKNNIFMNILLIGESAKEIVDKEYPKLERVNNKYVPVDDFSRILLDLRWLRNDIAHRYRQVDFNILYKNYVFILNELHLKLKEFIASYRGGIYLDYLMRKYK